MAVLLQFTLLESRTEIPGSWGEIEPSYTYGHTVTVRMILHTDAR